MQKESRLASSPTAVGAGGAVREQLPAARRKWGSASILDPAQILFHFKVKEKKNLRNYQETPI